MPMYQCFAPNGVLSEDLKPQIAAEITRIHCEATGAPKAFVHVMMVEIRPGAHYTAAEPDSTTSIIDGSIRAGRSIEVRQQIMKEISNSWSRLTGQPESQIVINISEFESQTVMEFGLVMPNPADEDKWLHDNEAALLEAGVEI
jgi:phenylpyruvate tautomerase PptA (4-oxalocrotonate tautomerase family)